MGEFGGNAGLLSAWFDIHTGEWVYDMQMFKFGVQYIWWAVHVLDIVTMAVGISWALTTIFKEDWKGSKTTKNASAASPKSTKSGKHARPAKR